MNMKMLGFFLFAALTACGGPLKYQIHGSAKAPDADAKIVADVQKEAGLTKLKINGEHMAPPDRLVPGASTYVVWARKDDGDKWQRVGALKYDEGSRVGSIEEASVPLLSFDLEVSIEKGATPESPSSDVVLSQRVSP
jgi:hypothetical protein